jgi:hypothetical protein
VLSESDKRSDVWNIVCENEEYIARIDNGPKGDTLIVSCKAFEAMLRSAGNTKIKRVCVSK